MRPTQHRDSHVTVLQPYVPEYRIPFFNEVERLLADSGRRLIVVHGKPEGNQASRSDAGQGSWSMRISTTTLALPRHSLRLRNSLRLTRGSEVVVAELASGNLDTYALALRKKVPLLLWGHGNSYVTAHSQLDSRLELWLARRAAGVLAYTQGGADHLSENGVPRSKITVLNNSTDTIALRALRSTLTPAEIAQFRAEHGVANAPTVAYIGSLDDSKLLHLLFAAGDHLAQAVPGFQLIIAGDGPEREYVARESASRRSYVRQIGRVGQRELALIATVAGFLINPGRVGLVAVDAAALGMPIVTTDFQFHAPELEYLTPECLRTTSQDGESIARAALEWLTQPASLEEAKASASEIGDNLSVQHMAAQFVTAVNRVAQKQRRGQPVIALQD